MSIFNKKIVSIKSTPQAVTNTWVDIGSIQNVMGYDFANLYVDVVINSSSNVRVRALLVPADSTTEYTYPIEAITSTSVKVDAAYWELNSDADQNMLLPLDLRGATQVKFQIMAETVGVSAATVALKAEYSSKN
jgi:hypothetical protein